jgi:hypothetical protein
MVIEIFGQTGSLVRSRAWIMSYWWSCLGKRMKNIGWDHSNFLQCATLRIKDLFTYQISKRVNLSTRLQIIQKRWFPRPCKNFAARFIPIQKIKRWEYAASFDRFISGKFSLITNMNHLDTWYQILYIIFSIFFSIFFSKVQLDNGWNPLISIQFPECKSGWGTLSAQRTEKNPKALSPPPDKKSNHGWWKISASCTEFAWENN